MTILAKEMLVKNMYQNPNIKKPQMYLGITNSYLWRLQFLIFV